ncbi:LysE family translocator [Congregibacter sp.]|uniref:LysE family translocator n=1 Tax=Congregibacter sp. TaxID=2744308 RepID=UPI003F6CC177
MSFWEWLGLASLCLAGAASPGPSLAVVVSASLNGGKLSGLAASWAHAAGVGIYAGITVLGLGTLLSAGTGVFLVLQSAGALYLLWLALGLWRSAQSPAANSEQAVAKVGMAARDGFAIAFLNPKLAVFMLALFSQFVRPDASASSQLALVATALFIDGLWYTLITLVFSRGKWIDTLRENASRIDRVFALLLTMVAAVILTRALQGF